jgi:hypothetical protein
VKVRADEISAVRRLGLPVVETAEGPAFPQPCRCYREDRCTVYEERPSACRNYRCKLLSQYLEGGISLEESLLRVGQVRDLVASLRRRLTDGGATDLWQQLQTMSGEWLGSTPENRAISLDLAALLFLSQAHFHHRAPAREAFPA